MCLYPRTMLNKKYTANKKNKGVIPPILDIRTKYVEVGCGNCIMCRKKKSREWMVRLMEDIKENKNGKFVTLTFSDEAIRNLDEQIEDKELDGWERDNEIAKLAVKRFLERWRKHHGKSIRHWLVTELGHNGTNNIHLHGIVWTDEKIEEIRKQWGYGYIYPRTDEEEKANYVSSRTVNYMMKYVSKSDEYNKTYKSVVLTSPGIGKVYLKSPNSSVNKYKEEKTVDTYRTESGHKIAMPTYWRTKLYTDEQREKMWLNKMEGDRFIAGERVGKNATEQQINELYKWHRKINIELGYGTDKKQEAKYNYDKNKRNKKRQERIDKANNKNNNKKRN